MNRNVAPSGCAVCSQTQADGPSGRRRRAGVRRANPSAADRRCDRAAMCGAGDAHGRDREVRSAAQGDARPRKECSDADSVQHAGWLVGPHERHIAAKGDPADRENQHRCGEPRSSNEEEDHYLRGLLVAVKMPPITPRPHGPNTFSRAGLSAFSGPAGESGRRGPRCWAAARARRTGPGDRRAATWAAAPSSRPTTPPGRRP